MGILDVKRDRTIEKDGIWWIRIPLPREEIQIDVLVSRLLGSVPFDSLPPSTYNYTQMAVTLNSVITKKPTDYEDIKDFMDYPDISFVSQLYDKYMEEKIKFFEELEGLKKNKSMEHRTNIGNIHNPSIPSSSMQYTDDRRHVSTAEGVSSQNQSDIRGFQGSVPMDESKRETERTGHARAVISTS